MKQLNKTPTSTDDDDVLVGTVIPKAPVVPGGGDTTPTKNQPKKRLRLPLWGPRPHGAPDPQPQPTPHTRNAGGGGGLVREVHHRHNHKKEVHHHHYRELVVTEPQTVHVVVERPPDEPPLWRWQRILAAIRRWARLRVTLCAAVLAFAPIGVVGDHKSLAMAWAATLQDARVEASIPAAYIIAILPLIVILVTDATVTSVFQRIAWRAGLLITFTGLGALVSPWDVVALMTGVSA